MAKDKNFGAYSWCIHKGRYYVDIRDIKGMTLAKMRLNKISCAACEGILELLDKMIDSGIEAVEAEEATDGKG